MNVANSQLNQSPLHLLHRVQQYADDIFQREIGQNDTTPRQLAILTVVGSGEGLTQTDISDATGIDRSTVSELVARLTRRGLLARRKKVSDSRAYAVKLTAQGRDLLTRVEPQARAVEHKILTALGKQGPEFLDQLQTLVAKLDGGSDLKAK